jgi:hypothetical protein
MGNEVHLYTLGADPFVLQLGAVAFFIHQGQPASTTQPVNPPTSSSSTVIFRQTPLPGPYENYIIAPDRTGDLNRILDAQVTENIDLGVALERRDRTDAAEGEQFQILFDALSQYDTRTVSIHCVSLEAVEGSGEDG